MIRPSMCVSLGERSQVQCDDPISRMVARRDGSMQQAAHRGKVTLQTTVHHMSDTVEIMTLRVPTPSVDDSLGVKFLPALLSVIAGSVDTISFVGLGGLFTAHVTGNLVILAAHLVSGDEALVAPMLSVPVFVAALGVARFMAKGLELAGRASLRSLLLLQFLLLAGFLLLCVASGPRIDPNGAKAIFAGMLGVSAMAVQNALVQISLKGAPSTAVMTTNITRFMMDVGGMMFEREAADVARACRRAKITWPSIVGFVVGCSLGAAAEATIGLRSLALPTGIALLAFAVGKTTANQSGGQDR
jgi:uncharacterized membrane protein YoaK (UPF0700 family)